MATHSDHITQVEGKWEDLIRHSDQFAGRRVRVTVLSDEGNGAASMLTEIRRWLAEGENLDFSPPPNFGGNAFGDGLAEKFRKQGWIL